MRPESGHCRGRIRILPDILAGRSLTGAAFVDFLVDLGNLADPDLPFLVFHVEYVVYRPVKMISDIRYLLIQLIQGVA